MEIPQNGHGQGLDLAVAQDAIRRGDSEFAGQIAQRILNQSPDEPGALRILAETLIDKGHEAVARLAARRAAQLKPTAHNLMLCGAIEVYLGRAEEAAAFFRQSLKRDPDYGPTLRLMAHSSVMRYRFEEAEELANKSLAIEDHHQARCARAFSYLHARKWGEGWDDYAHGMGRQQFRDKHQYIKAGKPLPDWDGKAPGRILVYAEQGLGDQIAYCSALADTRVSEIVCDPKLAGILQRSLPGTVYGDQFTKEVDWEPRADWALSMSEMMRFKRRTKESFPKTPYLKPHPQKQLMWRALFDSLGDKPKVGIAWTGGKPEAVAFNGRNLDPSKLGPILSLPYDFVSLEYREGEPIPGVHEFPFGSRSKDFDDVAAMISCLDAVVCVPTTAYHAAGALGVQAFVIVHDKPHFHEGVTGSESPWWGSVEFIRRSEMGTAKAIEQTARKLQVHIENLHRNRPPPAGSVQRAEMVHRAAGDEARVGGAADSAAVAHH
jgi:tetratricopeptide (TPR) repeat protein